MNRNLYRAVLGIALLVALVGCRRDPLAGVPDDVSFYVPTGASPLDTKLIVAVVEGNLKNFTAALEEGANLQIEMSSGQTPSEYAVEKGRPEFLTAVLSKMTYGELNDAFLQAVTTGNDKIIQVFLGHGVAARKDILQEALVKMAGSSQLPSMREKPLFPGDDGRRLKSSAKTSLDLLLKNGARINKADRDGWMPLMEAAKYNRARMAYELLLRGADWKAKTKDGKTTLDIARSSKYGDGSTIPLLEAWQSGKHPEARGVKIVQ